MEMFGVKQQKVDFIKNENIGIFIKDTFVRPIKIVTKILFTVFFRQIWAER